MPQAPKPQHFLVALESIVVAIIDAGRASPTATFFGQRLARGRRSGILRGRAHFASVAGSGWLGNRFLNSSSISCASGSRPARRKSSMRSIHFSGGWLSNPDQIGARCNRAMAPGPASGDAAFWRVCGVGTGFVGVCGAEWLACSTLVLVSVSGAFLFARLSLCGSCLAGGGGAAIGLAACSGARYRSDFALASESDSLFLAIASPSGTGLAT